MPKLVAICPMQGGQPNLNLTDPAGANYAPVSGYVLAGKVGALGAYMFSGSGAQLTALNALPAVVGIVAVTESGTVKWAELDGVIGPALRTRLNTWLSARGYPTIPAGWTFRQVVVAIYKRINSDFNLGGFDVAE